MAKRVIEMTDSGRVITHTPRRVKYVALPITRVDTRWKRIKRAAIG